MNTQDQHQNSRATKSTLGKRERHLLSESVRVEEELVPGFVRPTLLLIALMVISFLLWSGFTNLTEVAVASGEIVPAGKIKVVQHLDGGIVDEILVERNARVEKDQVLLHIDGDKAIAEMLQMEARLAALDLRGERLRAFTEQRQPDFSFLKGQHSNLINDQRNIFINQVATRDSTLQIIKRQIEQRHRRITQLQNNLSAAQEQRKLTTELLEMRQDLAARKLIDRATLIETNRADITARDEVERLSEELNLVRQELAEAESRYLDTTNQLQQSALDELGLIRSEKAEITEALKQLRAKVERLEVRSPADGYVHNLQVQTVGQVIQPGALLMQIVPTNVRLEAEVKIAPKDIGYVQPGQPVNLRVGSYDYTRFGMAKGTLERISASNLLDEEGKSYFLGTVLFEKPYVGNNPDYPLQIGMSVDADILTGEKTLLSYLLKPVAEALSRAFTER